MCLLHTAFYREGLGGKRAVNISKVSSDSEWEYLFAHPNFLVELK